MRSSQFSASVGRQTAAAKNRNHAIFRESLQRVFEVANTPRAKGGLTPLDTGYMINSFTVSIGSVPAGLSTRPPASATESLRLDGSSIALVLNNAKIGDVVYGGWAANYAVYMEERYGFMRSAAQKWPQIVGEVVAEARARFPA